MATQDRSRAGGLRSFLPQRGPVQLRIAHCLADRVSLQADRRNRAAPWPLAFLSSSRQTSATTSAPRPGRSSSYPSRQLRAFRAPAENFLFWFAIHYPDGAPIDGDVSLRCLPLLFPGRRDQWARHCTQLMRWGHVTNDLAGGGYLLPPRRRRTALRWWYLGWLAAAAKRVRQRFTWLLGVLRCSCSGPFRLARLSFVPGAEPDVRNLVSVLGSFAMYIGLSYAILRLRARHGPRDQPVVGGRSSSGRGAPRRVPAAAGGDRARAFTSTIPRRRGC